MSMQKTLLVVSMMGALSFTRSAAAETWKGDFESGDFTQWEKTEMVSGDPTRLKIVDAAAIGAYGIHQGKYALRVTVRQGDDPIMASGNRAELVHAAGKPYSEGDDIYLAWSTLFPTDFGTTDTWQVFTQFHHTGCCGSPPLEFDIAKDKLQLTSQKEGVFDETALWSTPLVRGKWHDFVWHIKWSQDAAIGLVELWYDGVHVLPPKHVRTLFSDGKAYLKQGYYRNDTITWQGVLYHDGTRIGPTYDSVAPTMSDDAGTDASPVVDASTPSEDAATDTASSPPEDAVSTSDSALDVGDAAFSPGSPTQPAAATSDDTGCSCTTAGASSSRGASLAMLFALMAVRLRRFGRK